ncbi:hypothetical protein [Salinicoccus kekensis]|uniref:Uncharacterized protein n=1 Tax=Salinicoccus kekensis TaxID=714307 RepID=A0A285UK46_9STAP|nr:hypothetical protein [Salinicoccus kekensis]SOC41758.1 hypothetical protein SAMN05878391_1404 [Salinicoccus kekensis]
MGKKTKLITAAGVTAGALYVSANTEKVKKGIDKGMEMAVSQVGKWTDDPYIKNLGRPEDLRDSNMVDEGAMTSVLYYYELREASRKKAQNG